MNDFMGQMIRTGDEMLAVDFGIGAIAYGAGICWLWAGVTGKPCDGRGFWITFLAAATLVFLVASNAPFVAGRILRTFFFNVALPAGGWLSFLILVVFAGGVIGYLFHKHGGTVSWGNMRRLYHDDEDALPGPCTATRITNESAQRVRRIALAAQEPEPVRLTRQSTSPAVYVRRDSVRR